MGEVAAVVGGDPRSAHVRVRGGMDSVKESTRLEKQRRERIEAMYASRKALAHRLQFVLTKYGAHPEMLVELHSLIDTFEIDALGLGQTMGKLAMVVDTPQPYTHGPACSCFRCDP